MVWSGVRCKVLDDTWFSLLSPGMPDRQRDRQTDSRIIGPMIALRSRRRLAVETYGVKLQAFEMLRTKVDDTH